MVTGTLPSNRGRLHSSLAEKLFSARAAALFLCRAPRLRHPCRRRRVERV